MMVKGTRACVCVCVYVEKVSLKLLKCRSKLLNTTLLYSDFDGAAVSRTLSRDNWSESTLIIRKVNYFILPPLAAISTRRSMLIDLTSSFTAKSRNS